MPAAEPPRQHPSRLISSSLPKPRQLPAGASLTSRTPCQNPFGISRHPLVFAWCRPSLWLFPPSSAGMSRTGHDREDAVSGSPCRVLSWSPRLPRHRPVAVGQLRSALFFGQGVVSYQVVDVVVQRRRVFDPPQHRQLRLFLFGLGGFALLALCMLTCRTSFRRVIFAMPSLSQRPPRWL